MAKRGLLAQLTWIGWRGRMADVSREGGSPSGGGRQMPDRDRPAPGRVCVQAAPLGAFAQGPGPAGGGQKRLRVEALLAAAASPLPPPAADLVPDATLTDELFPEDLPRLLGLLGRGTCTCKRRSRSPCTRP